jgi:CheY-like chemotaxis protein
VVAALEAALAGKTALDDNVEPRVALYRLFTKIWSSASIQGTGHDVEPADRSERKIVNMTALPRQAFLLTQLEGFDNSAAARILDVDAATLSQLIADSGCELADLISTDVLIIEDEAFIAIELTELVQRLGHSVIGVAKTHAGAIALMKDKIPGLILADIQLADGSSGLDAVNELLGRFAVPVIFITAYPERFLTGQRPEPAFLIAKPFEPGTVCAVVSQALFFERNAKRRERPVPA